MIDWFRYDRATTVVHAQDDFSQFRKWHQGLFDAAEQQQGGGDGGSVEGTNPTAAFGLNTSAFSLSSIPGADRDRGYNWRETAPSKQASSLRPASPSKLDPAVVSAMDACFEDDIETHIAKAASVVTKPLRPSSPSMQLRSISLSPASEAVQEHASLAPAAAQSSHSLAPASTQASHSTIPDSESLPSTPPRHTPSPNLPEPGPVTTNTTDKRGTALYLRSTSLDRAIGRQQHTVNLLPLDGRDSADLFLPRTYSHSPQQHQHQHDPPLSTSYEEDRRVYDALPNYPDSIPTFESPPRPMGSEKPQYMDTEEEAFPSLEQLSSTAVDPIPTEEEADMETYLSWLNSQEPSASVQHQPQQLLSTVVPPTAAPVAAITTSSQKLLPQQRQEKQQKQQQPLQTTPVRRNSDPIIASKTASNSSNIPRYSNNRPSGISTNTSTTNGTGTTSTATVRLEEEEAIINKVFSPRDAAMRAEQTDALSASAGKSKFGKSAFQSRTHFS